MVAGLYGMFARHGVKTSNNELLVEFDFGNNGKLSFDANHFKKAIAARAALVASVQTVSSSTGEMHEIFGQVLGALADCYGLVPDKPSFFVQDIAVIDGVTCKSDHPPSDQEARDWIGYKAGTTEREHATWPFHLPVPLPRWSSGDPLGEAVKPLEGAIVYLSHRVRDYGSWDGLERRRRELETDPTMHTAERSPINEWSEYKVSGVQHDRLSVSLLRALWLLYDLAPKDPQPRAALAADVASRLGALVTVVQHPWGQRALEEILALPLWQARSQLYSVWLVTVVESAVPEYIRFELRPIDGRLKFAFEKTLVASLTCGATVIELLAEVKTTAHTDVALAGKSRVSAIQPDYILRELEGGKVLYVLEAKQYRKGSKGNFSAALRDYAEVLDTALVAIANYGSVPTSLKEAIEGLVDSLGTRLDSPLVDRCAAFADVRPRHGSLEALKDHIRSVLPPAEAVFPALLVDATTSMLTQIPIDPAQSGIWSALLSWQGRVLFVNSSSLTEFDRSEGTDLAVKLMEVARPEAMDFSCELPEDCVFVTDEDGASESKRHHHRFQGVVILRDQGERFRLVLGPNMADHAFSTLCVRGYVGGK